MAQTKNSAVIKSNRLFSGVYDIGFNFKEKNYIDVKEGEVIYSRGDKSEYMYLLVNGRVKFKTYENPRQPKIFLVSKNEFFGERELIDRVPRNSSAVAEKDSTLFRISHKDFIKITGSHKKIFDNLKDQKYEEVVAPSRKTELKEDIFKRILNEAEIPVKRDTGIELRDYSYENPLLELKAKDEITDELKMYSDDEDTNLQLTDEDLIIDDEGVTWEFGNEDKEEEKEKEKEKSEPVAEEITDQEINYEELKEEELKEEEIKEEEIPVFDDEDEKSVDIIDNFLKMQEQVDEFRESLAEGEEEEFKEPEPVEPFRLTTPVTVEAYISAVEKISSGLEKEETDELIVQACTGLVNAERGVLYFPDINDVLKGKLFEEGGEITASAESIPGRCFSESQIINIKDVFNDPDFNPSLDYVSYFHIHSVVCLPIVNGENVKAVLQLFNNRNGEFSENDVQLLKNISPVILRSIERYERYERKTELKDQQISDILAEEEIWREEAARIEEIKKTVEFQTEELGVEEEKIVFESSDEDEKQISDVFEEEERKTEEKEQKHEKYLSLKVLSDFLIQEFQSIIRDTKQFNAYLQRIDIPGETKEISDIVTNQSVKILDLIEALKGYSEARKFIFEEKLSYVSVFDNIVNLLAEYTEGRKVNLYKRFEADSDIMADPKFLYLAVFQIIKYQCDLMPLGGNIFISSVVSEETVEVLIRNATKKTDETLVIAVPLEYNEDTPTGMGLSLAKRIIEEHNAVLEVRNQSGTGLEVVIRFLPA